MQLLFLVTLGTWPPWSCRSRLAEHLSAFPFASYFNPQFKGVGALRVLNEDWGPGPRQLSGHCREHSQAWGICFGTSATPAHEASPINSTQTTVTTTLLPPTPYHHPLIVVATLPLSHSFAPYISCLASNHEYVSHSSTPRLPTDTSRSTSRCRSAEPLINLAPLVKSAPFGATGPTRTANHQSPSNKPCQPWARRPPPLSAIITCRRSWHSELRYGGPADISVADRHLLRWESHP